MLDQVDVVAGMAMDLVAISMPHQLRMWMVGHSRPRIAQATLPLKLHERKSSCQNLAKVAFNRDLGASEHMYTDVDIFVATAPNKYVVLFADGSNVRVKIMGTVNLPST